jgi:TPP-dependent indolepyruvate ferredoxin oxidoreductase alpha subunit
MSWQMVTALGGLAVALLGALNSWLMLQMKARTSHSQLKVETEIGALRVEIVESRALDRDTLRHWAEAEFVRKDSLSSQLATWQARLERLEDRRRADYRAHVN